MERPIKVVPHEHYTGMHRLEWSDGVKSADFYNLSRAKDILRRYDDYLDGMRRSKQMQGNTIRRKFFSIAKS